MQLIQAFERIHRFEVDLRSRMTAHLDGRASRDARPLKKSFTGNRVRLRLPLALQTIERPAIQHVTPDVADRHTQTVSSFEQELSHRFPEMNVLMRIEVCGIPTDERSECVQLSIDFRCDGSGIADRNSLVVGPPRAVAIRPLAEVYVETDAESLPPFRRRNCSRCVRPADHEARAGDDAVLVRLR